MEGIVSIKDVLGNNIKFKIDSFPDGQQNVTVGNLELITNKEVFINARFNSFRHLEQIICTVKSLRGLGAEKIHLYTPYFLGARSDRKFQDGGNNYLKDVICPIINSLELESIKVLDPHSDVLEGCLNNFIKTYNYKFIKMVLSVINHRLNHEYILMSPDAGSLKKIYDLSEYLSFTGTIVNCEKQRDNKGNIIKTVVPHFDITKDILLIDDICDGGKTFIEIAKIIRERQNNLDEHNTDKPGKLYLAVTHGIFSKGFDELRKYFDKMFFTDSVLELEKTEDEFINQLSIF